MVKKNYQLIELEVTRLVQVAQKARTLILSIYKTPVIAYTNYVAAINIAKQTFIFFTNKIKNYKRIVNTSQFLSQFPLMVRYILEKTNIIADALSRLLTYVTKLALDSNELDRIQEKDAAFIASEVDPNS